MKRLFHNHGLSIVLGLLFFLFWGAQAFSGFRVQQEQAALHGSVPPAFSAYLASGHFWQATAENWESEFLQMAAYVLLTTFLFQRGSAESHDPDKSEELKRRRRDKSAPWWYRNSLSLAFSLLFLCSFALHFLSGWRMENETREEHALPAQSGWEFIRNAEFWFQSFQNWQSEFLAVLSIVALSVFLRQQGSPESKNVQDPHSKTGKSDG